MKCPVDGTELHQHSLGAGSFHECPTCHGLFFRRQLLLGVVHHQRHTSVHVSPPKSPSRSAWRGLKNCPACRRPTINRVLHEVEADVCVPCQAVWLDPGEIQQIIQQLPPKSPRPISGGRSYSAGDFAVDSLLSIAGEALLEFVSTIFDGLP